MAGKKLGGWWRLWLVSIPVWWAVCLWQHKTYVDRTCAPMVSANAFGAFSECFTGSRDGWVLAAILGPVFILGVIAAGRWVLRGFDRDNKS